ncbi:hypothetical protein HK405_009128, partial [Cladochytrium tenue]
MRRVPSYSVGGFVDIDDYGDDDNGVGDIRGAAHDLGGRPPASSAAAVAAVPSYTARRSRTIIPNSAPIIIREDDAINSADHLVARGPSQLRRPSLVPAVATAHALAAAEAAWRRTLAMLHSVPELPQPQQQRQPLRPLHPRAAWCVGGGAADTYDASVSQE